MSIISGITHDAQTRLDVRSSEVVGTGLYRPNVRLEVIRVDGEANKRRKLVELLNRLRGPGFVSAAGPKAVDDLTAYLADWGVPVAGFHDKLPGKRREIAEDRFLACELKALIAASGSEPPIEGATLRYLVHYHPPTSLDAFVREIGHVWRDGRPIKSSKGPSGARGCRRTTI
jgi:ATP-dependent DNA helicase RecQ